MDTDVFSGVWGRGEGACECDFEEWDCVAGDGGVDLGSGIWGGGEGG